MCSIFNYIGANDIQYICVQKNIVFFACENQVVNLSSLQSIYCFFNRVLENFSRKMFNKSSR